MRYLILYDYKKYNATYDRIKHLRSKKRCTTDSINHNFARMRLIHITLYL